MSGVDVTSNVGKFAQGTSSIVNVLVGDRLPALSLFSFVLSRHTYVHFRAPLSMSVVSQNALVTIMERGEGYAWVGL